MAAPAAPAHGRPLSAPESCAAEAGREPQPEAGAGESGSLAGSADEESRIAREALARRRPTRTATVSALRGALGGGAYAVDAAVLAEKMLGGRDGGP